MPEGDTVWLTCKRLHEALAGHVLTRGELRVPQVAALDLTGATINEVVARGKHILIRVQPADGPALTLHSHLRMDGAWVLRLLDSPTRLDDPHIRVLLETDTMRALGVDLGEVDVLRTSDEAALLGYLGPDLLGPDWDLAEAVRRVGSVPERALHEALLDQGNVAGIGNLYGNELCFLFRSHPTTRVGDVADMTAVLAKAQQLLEVNKNRGAQSTTGELGPGKEQWVFERGGRPCRRCGSRIKSGLLGVRTQERFVYWCPTCQPGPDLPKPPRQRAG
jgi:endonuclease-8